ncbi:MAG: FkbM family methyltransferase [Planctomyces sp.]|nr:FkbM family methyltransferase [Planctomyces sp.]
MSLKSILNGILAPMNLELHRRPDPELPCLHTVQIDGTQKKLWISNGATKSWWLRPEIAMNGELKELKRLTSAGDTVLEIGAHHGLMTLLLSGWTGESGVVHAVEASAENAVVLNANCFCNDVKNVVTTFSAAGKACGEVQFGGESLAASMGVIRRVPMITLDSYCEQKSVKKIDLLKIDVEGFEADVLAGATSVLRQMPKLALELHVDLLPGAGSSAKAVWRTLEEQGLLKDRQITMVCRPDWNSVRVIKQFNDLPTDGVVNLFIS